MATWVVKTKSKGNMPKWLIFLMLGLVALVITPYFFTLETKEFDARIEKMVEEIRGRIARGESREIFLASDRELIASFDETEFAAHLAPARQFLSGKYEKIGGGGTRFDTLADRLNRFIGRPYIIYTAFLLENETSRAGETFSWKVRGDEVKLLYIRNEGFGQINVK
jgi:hypothetical protein